MGTKIVVKTPDPKKWGSATEEKVAAAGDHKLLVKDAFDEAWKKGLKGVFEGHPTTTLELTVDDGSYAWLVKTTTPDAAAALKAVKPEFAKGKGTTSGKDPAALYADWYNDLTAARKEADEVGEKQIDLLLGVVKAARAKDGQPPADFGPKLTAKFAEVKKEMVLRRSDPAKAGIKPPDHAELAKQREIAERKHREDQARMQRDAAERKKAEAAAAEDEEEPPTDKMKYALVGGVPTAQGMEGMDATIQKARLIVAAVKAGKNPHEAAKIGGASGRPTIIAGGPDRDKVVRNWTYEFRLSHGGTQFRLNGSASTTDDKTINVQFKYLGRGH